MMIFFRPQYPRSSVQLHHILQNTTSLNSTVKSSSFQFPQNFNTNTEVNGEWIQGPPGIFRNDIYLCDLDDASQRSLNGVRLWRLMMTDQTLIKDVDKLRAVLWFVKFWAKRRGIYANICGYFGGITWALCVAKVGMKLGRRDFVVVLGKEEI